MAVSQWRCELSADLLARLRLVGTGHMVCVDFASNSTRIAMESTSVASGSCYPIIFGRRINYSAERLMCTISCVADGLYCMAKETRPCN